MGRNPEFKCTICGKWISYIDLDEGSIVVDYTPDTDVSVELTEMYHKKCSKQMID